VWATCLFALAAFLELLVVVWEVAHVDRTSPLLAPPPRSPDVDRASPPLAPPPSLFSPPLLVSHSGSRARRSTASCSRSNGSPAPSSTPSRLTSGTRRSAGTAC
jgi:hypothetical protein